MTHKHFSAGLNLAAAFALVTGISMAGAYAPTYAALSGYGSMVTEKAAVGAELRSAAGAVPIDLYVQADAAAQLALGVLLITLGFFLHGLSRMRDERPVKVRKGSKKKHSQKFLWMQLDI